MMKIIRNPEEMQQEVLKLKQQGKSIGVVPTMGALHAGHLSLVQRARKENDTVIATIFVNPIQFGPGEDLDAYPRTFEADREKLETEKTDYLFFPKTGDMYPKGYASYVEVSADFTEKLCGAKRPGHFRGVTTVVSILFHLTLPDRAYFGLKDYQQVLVIQKMVKDLRFPLKVVPVPIFRENDGLAMSSRNRYLSPEERRDAALLYESLMRAKKAIREGESSAEEVRKNIENTLAESPHAKVDYIEITDPNTLEPVSNISDSPVLIALAVFIGKARLIDNMLISKEP
jgi:pantoate--beta-alanine ligase